MNPEPLSAAAPFAVVVNDDPTQLNVLAGLVRKAGLEPRAFTGAEAALAAISTGAPPALIVTDLYMPGLDGWRFCRLLRSPEYLVFNQVPIVVVSATYAGAEAARIATDLGAEAFLPSPVDGRQFCEQVRRILSGDQVRNPLRVLIVDDNAPFCDLLKEIFVNHGYEATTAFTVQAAAAALKKTAYDVAVLDYHLPDGLGDALLDTFRAQHPDCVCLMMTSDPGPELALEWMKRGAAAYLKKPFPLGYIIELCARARRERALLRVQDLLEFRTRELQEREDEYRTLFNSAGDAIFIHNPEARMLAVNPLACERLGYTSAELMSMTVNQVDAPEESPHAAERIARLMEQGQLSFETVHRRKDGSLVPTEVSARRISWRGQPAMMSICRDITARKQADELIRAALLEKEALLKEVHHRVKNNLQVITSLLRLEAGRSNHAETKSVLKEMQGRIRSMALLHETLYRSGNFAQVDLAAYLKQLSTQLFRSLVAQPGAIQFRLNVESVHLTTDQTIPCGLIVNELVTNCLKHGFPDGRTGEVRIELQPVSGGTQLRLRVSDTGVGLPADFESKRGKSLGLQLVSDLARQIGGQLEVGPGPSAVFEVTFTPKHSKPTPSSPPAQPGGAETKGEES